MKVRVEGRFEMDAVADRFPGLLTFRGAPADADGVTEIEGDVDPRELLSVVDGVRLRVRSCWWGRAAWFCSGAAAGAIGMLL